MYASRRFNRLPLPAPWRYSIFHASLSIWMTVYFRHKPIVHTETHKHTLKERKKSKYRLYRFAVATWQRKPASTVTSYSQDNNPFALPAVTNGLSQHMRFSSLKHPQQCRQLRRQNAECLHRWSVETTALYGRWGQWLKWG